MGVTKTEVYTEAHNRMAGLFKALGHPARLAILQHLLSDRCCMCCDFATEIGLAQPTVSRHLKVLKEAGLIHGKVEGNTMKYWVDTERLRSVRAMIGELIPTIPAKDSVDL
jgi:DNA-binding transcriptional ArsR family regulator